MKNFKDIDWQVVFQLAILIGTIILALAGVDGWGWLLFVLVLTF